LLASVLVLSGWLEVLGVAALSGVAQPASEAPPVPFISTGISQAKLVVMMPISSIPSLIPICPSLPPPPWLPWPIPIDPALFRLELSISACILSV
jgi:hypothetical protein